MGFRRPSVKKLTAVPKPPAARAVKPPAKVSTPSVTAAAQKVSAPTRLTTVAKVAGGSLATGVGLAAITGILPGFSNFPSALGGLATGIANSGVGLTTGLTSVFSNLPLIAAGGAALGLVVLLRR